MRTRAHHLHEERLFESYLAVRGGEMIDPPVAEHLTDCEDCRQRYSALTQFMDGLDAEATSETDAVFTPDRLRLQRAQIASRLEHVGHLARVITFPGRARRHVVAPPRSARRWIAAAAAAGLFVGVGTGLFLDWEGARRPGRRAAATLVRQTILTAPSATVEMVRPQASDADEAFLSELELAGDRPRIGELLAVDALTPHVREITLR